MNSIQLNPPILVEVQGHGTGEAHCFLDYGVQHSPMFVVFMDDTGKPLIASFDSITKVDVMRTNT